jgi:hypothetical protein
VNAPLLSLKVIAVTLDESLVTVQHEDEDDIAEARCAFCLRFASEVPLFQAG